VAVLPAPLLLLTQIGISMYVAGGGMPARLQEGFVVVFFCSKGVVS